MSKKRLLWTVQFNNAFKNILYENSLYNFKSVNIRKLIFNLAQIGYKVSCSNYNPIYRYERIQIAADMLCLMWNDSHVDTIPEASEFCAQKLYEHSKKVLEGRDPQEILRNSSHIDYYLEFLALIGVSLEDIFNELGQRRKTRAKDRLYNNIKKLEFYLKQSEIPFFIDNNRIYCPDEIFSKEIFIISNSFFSLVYRKEKKAYNVAPHHILEITKNIYYNEENYEQA